MVIFINKTTQILEILYPESIPTVHFDFVATVILPDIRKLVGMVGMPQKHETPLEESKYSVQCVSAPLSENTEPESSTYDIKDGELIGVDDKNDVVTCSNPMFAEDAKHAVDGSWQSIAYNESEHLKKGEDIRIKGNGCIIDTTWEYLIDYFNSLPDTIKIIDINGLNKKKQVTLVKFYRDHPNFQCHIDKVSNVNSLVKDEVHVSVQTTPDDAGTVYPEHYGE